MIFLERDTLDVAGLVSEICDKVYVNMGFFTGILHWKKTIPLNAIYEKVILNILHPYKNSACVSS